MLHALTNSWGKLKNINSKPWKGKNPNMRRRKIWIRGSVSREHARAKIGFLVIFLAFFSCMCQNLGKFQSYTLLWGGIWGNLGNRSPKKSGEFLSAQEHTFLLAFRDPAYYPYMYGSNRDPSIMHCHNCRLSNWTGSEHYILNFLQLWLDAVGWLYKLQAEGLGKNSVLC